MAGKPRRTFTVDSSTYASNPGRLRVSYLHWICSFPGKPVQLILPLAILVGVAFLMNRVFFGALFELLHKGKSLDNVPGALLGIVIFNVFFWLGISPLLEQLIFLANRIREHFLYGCVNPGIVVASKPPIVAVFTDLTRGSVPHHAIKILPQPLKRIKGGAPPVGTKLAIVALYEGIAQKGHWDNFHPVVINCVTGNITDIKRIYRSIPDWEWQALEAGLRQIQTPQKPGLYFIPSNPPSF